MRRIIMILGLLWMYSLSTLLVWTFLHAYTSQAKKILIDINTFGEAKIEFFVFMFVVTLMTIALDRILEVLENVEEGKSDKR